MPTNPNDTWGLTTAPRYVGYSMGTTVPYTIADSANATTYTYSGNANYEYETSNNYVTISFDSATSGAVCTFVDNIPNMKCIDVESLNDIIIPKFDCCVNRRISIGIGIFAQKTFCKDFVWAEYKVALIEFADNFISKLIKDNLLVYSHEDNEYTMKKD